MVSLPRNILRRTRKHGANRRVYCTGYRTQFRFCLPLRTNKEHNRAASSKESPDASLPRHPPHHPRLRHRRHRRADGGAARRLRRRLGRAARPGGASGLRRRPRLRRLPVVAFRTVIRPPPGPGDDARAARRPAGAADGPAGGHGARRARPHRRRDRPAAVAVFAGAGAERRGGGLCERHHRRRVRILFRHALQQRRGAGRPPHRRGAVARAGCERGAAPVRGAGARGGGAGRPAGASRGARPQGWSGRSRWRG
jgi:hypothetical protein